MMLNARLFLVCGAVDAQWNKEGDEWNAGYWYKRAGRPKCSLSFEDEWEEIVQAMIQEN